MVFASCFASRRGAVRRSPQAHAANGTMLRAAPATPEQKGVQ